MGIYYRATGLIGYELSISRFFEDKAKPNCQHNPSGSRFCPECGTPAGTVTTRTAKQAWWDFSDNFLNHLPTGYVAEYLHDYHGEKIWFGYGSSVDEGAKVLLPRSFDEIKTQIAILLQRYIETSLLELDENTFGFWTIHAGH